MYDTPWKLCFDGLVCDDDQGIGVVLIPLDGAIFDMSNWLDENCTNNQVGYEAILFVLEVVQSLGMKHVKVFGDSVLVVQQVSKVCRC